MAKAVPILPENFGHSLADAIQAHVKRAEIQIAAMFALRRLGLDAPQSDR
jgi:hypothetical protein